MTRRFARSDTVTRFRAAAVFVEVAIWVLVFIAPSPAHAERTRRNGAGEAPAPARAEYSDYEQETIHLVLAERKARVDPAPQGKWIESVDVVALDVIEPRDPAPGFLNWFHATTRESVVRREVLLAPGDKFDYRLVEESERNLRSVRQLSLVLIVPVRGSRPDRVRLLVITKDVWSLRLNSNFRITNGELEFLFLQPSEENLFGRHYSISGQYLLEPDTHSIGGLWVNPRIAGSRISSLVSANVILNRETGKGEGSFGSFQFGQPLYSTQTEWAWQTALLWRNEVTRRFRGLEQVTFDADDTAAEDELPYEFDTEYLFWQTAVTRSFGDRYKTNIGWGLEANRLVFDTQRLAAFNPVAVREFTREQVPTSDSRVGPFVQLSAYSTDFIRLLDVNTLGLQEDYALGHYVFLKAYPAAKAASSSRDILGLAAGVAYTVPMGDGLARAYGASRIEFAGEQRQSQAMAETGLRLVTPTLAVARLVYDGVILNRYRNYLKERSSLGGDTRLRGYASEAFFGKDVVASNVELRSRAVALWTVHLGAVAFYDAGDAFDGFENFELKHGVGFGFRAAVPQLQRVVGRLDVGFPLSRDRVSSIEAPGPYRVVLTLEGQAFDMPQISPLSPVVAGD